MSSFFVIITKNMAYTTTIPISLFSPIALPDSTASFLVKSLKHHTLLLPNASQQPITIGSSKFSVCFLEREDREETARFKRNIFVSSSTEVLIKVIAQVIPTYMMSILRFPMIFWMIFMVYAVLIGADQRM